MKTPGVIKELLSVALMLMFSAAHADIAALWKYDTNLDPQPDSTLNSNDAAWAGNLSWVSDIDRGGVMEFDGNDDYLEAADSVSLSIVGDMTIAAWIKVTDFNGYRGIVGKTNGNLPAPYDYYLYNGDGRPRFVRGDGIVNQSITATDPPALGIWQHVAVTMAGTTVTHWLNGQFNGSGTLSTTIADADGTLRIGSRADLATDMLGRMDDVVIYDYALTASQINKRMNTPSFIQTGMALDFVNTDDRVIFSNFSAMPTTAITAEFWIKTSDTTRNAGLISYAVGGAVLANEFLIFDSDDLQILVKGESTGPTGLSVADGLWHHVAVTWDSFSGQTLLYIDGITNDLGVLAQGQTITGSGTVVFGDEQDSLGGGFVASEALIGQLDEIRLWNTVRLQVDIEADRCQSLNGTETNLISYWPCDLLEDLGVNGDGADDIADVTGMNPGDTENGLLLLVNDGDGDGIVDECDTESVHNITQVTDYFTIQSAIDASADGDIIEVDPGTYLEAINFNGMGIILRSTSGDPNDTIIDGTGHFHVVQCVNGEDPNTVFSGFTINGGNADSGWPDNEGGGMRNFNSSPTVTNCIFTENSAHYGAGMANSNSNPIVSHCIFINNWAEVQCSGMWNGGSNPTVTSCTFSNNFGSSSEGVMTNRFLSSPIVRDCLFNNNSDGGMTNIDSTPMVINTIFSENRSGITNSSSSNSVVTDCTFSGNTYSGMSIISSAPSVTNCTFNGNGGRGIWIVNSNPIITNCTFSGNTTTDNGAGISVIDGSPVVANSTFSGNTAGANGGGMYVSNGSPTVVNSVFWNNSDSGVMDESAQIHVDTGAPVVIYTNVMGGWTGTGSTGNINTDPLFVDPNGVDGIYGTDDDDLRLQVDSPCIDAGLSIEISTDLDANTRIVDDPNTIDTGVGYPDVVDMGAYEFGSTPPCKPLQGDINCDGIVDLQDFILMAANWLETV